MCGGYYTKNKRLENSGNFNRFSLEYFIHSILFLFSFLLYNCNSAIEDNNKEEVGSQVEIYSKVIETVDFVLPAGCRWEYTILNRNSSGVSLINSQEELLKHLSCVGNPIKNSLRYIEFLSHNKIKRQYYSNGEII